MPTPRPASSAAVTSATIRAAVERLAEAGWQDDTRFAEALVLPEHFGRNLDALMDCLRDVADRHENTLRGARENFARAAAIGRHHGKTVRERLDATELGVARMIADRIVRDTDLPEQFARLLGHSLAGLSQMTARAWLEHGSEIPRDAAAQAAGHLAWRGIGAFPTRATAAAYREAGGAGS